MNIDKALQHFEYKLKNHWKPTAKDIEAYNSILDFKEHRQSVSLSENELLAKLWIHQLMLLNTSNLYSAERSIQVIDEILSKSVYDWVLRLTEQMNTMRFNASLNKSNTNILNYDLKPLEVLGSSLESLCKDEAQLQKEFTDKISEDKIIKFVEIHINRAVNKF